MNFGKVSIPCHYHRDQEAILLLPPNFPYILFQSWPILLSPPAPGNHLSTLSLWSLLFCIFHINGIIQHVAFCVWLLSLSMFSRFIHVVVCIGTSFLYMVEFYIIIWIHHIFFMFIYLFIYLFLAVLGLCCCARAFSSCGEWGLLLVAVCGLLIVMASLVEHRL